MNIRVGPIGRAIAPGYGWCLRCGTPWLFVREHLTPYEMPQPGVAPGHSCFPLCELCWRDLGTPAARLPYYADLWGTWRRQGSERPARVWCAIVAAVEAGG